jgi:replicative superfamily II helicase
MLKQTSNVQKKYPNLKDRILQKVINNCVGFHHAGMIRSDRNAV